MQGIRPGWVERQRGDRRHEGHDEAKRNIDLHQSRYGPLDELNPFIHGQDLLSIHHDALHLLLDEGLVGRWGIRVRVWVGQKALHILNDGLPNEVQEVVVGDIQNNLTSYRRVREILQVAQALLKRRPCCPIRGNLESLLLETRYQTPLEDPEGHTESLLWDYTMVLLHPGGPQVA